MSGPIRVGSEIPPDAFRDLRRDMMLEGCKWDPQVEDVETLARFPLYLTAAAWQQLREWSQRLAAETLAAEQELLRQPGWLRELGLPRPILKCLGEQEAVLPSESSLPRVMRFDFHWTTAGWQVSEVNCDVPGGFVEGSGLPRRMASSFPRLGILPDPAERYVARIIGAQFEASHLALVHATAYSDDRQVMEYLARILRKQGASVTVCGPTEVRWKADGVAQVAGQDLTGIVRFFPAEWLPQLGRDAAWQCYFQRTRTPISNPGTALITQSKRWPLLWDRLASPTATWRQLCPETRDPRAIRRSELEEWVFKPALGRVGDGVVVHGVTASATWRKHVRQARWWPRHWAAQRRFDMVPLAGAQGPIFPAIGVFVVADEVAGVYGRIASQPVINHLAQDVAVLVELDEGANDGR